MKRTLLILCALLAMAYSAGTQAQNVWDGTVAGSFAGGNGTAEDPYLIADGAQLARFASMVNSGQTGINGKLTADILLNDTTNWKNWETTAPANSWTPIGSDANRFTGTLDGDGHSVSGIYINSTASYQGLVGVLGEGGTLQDLGVKASYIKGGNDVGGVCGQNYATMTNCYNTGKVTGSYFVGGLCGMNYGTVNNCYNTGSVAGSSRVGGLCGRNDGIVSNCYNTGNVAGTERVGGVCGYNYYATVTNCYNTGNVTGTGDYVGGVCGENYTTVTNCYNTGSVEGTNRVGGVCGYNYSATVTNCYNTGNVTGNNLVGGVCGYNYSATVTNCYNNGNVAGNYNAGGVCGYNEGTVSNCYYLNTCGAAGVGTSKTADEFASGEVAWLLQNEQAEQVWGQNLTLAPKDTYPVLGGLKVVQNGNGYVNELKQDGDFYLISTADELRLFASMVNGGQTSINGKLTADILLNDTTNWTSWNETTAPANSWTPIGNSSQPFTGTLDGDGHSVSGIYINSTANYQGLVGYLGSGGTLQNLGVKASYIKGGYSVGGVCGRNDGTVTNCYNSGSVAGNNYVGGVCGMNGGGTVTNCYNTGSVAGNGYVGGLCGLNYGTVTNCYNTGSVEGNNSVGGLCGWNDGTVTNCYNTGSVEGNYSVGGLCGQNSATVTNCYYLTGMAAGGINGSDAAGQAEAKTETEFASGEVAWLLQGEKAEQVWGQAIGTDESPVWQTEGNKVYKLTLQNGEEANPLYANSGNFTLPAPAEREGYTFAGWFTAQADGTQVQDDATLTADLTLYAQWTANSYTIRFVNADGTVLQSSEVEYGQTPAYNGETPTKESTAEFDYTFAGWTPQIANVTEEATYTATYTETRRSYTLTVALAEGCEEMGEVSGSGSYEYGTVVTLTATAHEGYKFMQWSDGDTNATRTIIVEGDMTLTATFEAEGGSETGLEEQMADTFQVIGMERSVRIEGSEQEACVFNTAGQLIYRGTERIIEVHAAGIYLVRIGNETKRVMVR